MNLMPKSADSDEWFCEETSGLTGLDVYGSVLPAWNNKMLDHGPNTRTPSSANVQ